MSQVLIVTMTPMVPVGNVTVFWDGVPVRAHDVDLHPEMDPPIGVGRDRLDLGRVVPPPSTALVTFRVPLASLSVEYVPDSPDRLVAVPRWALEALVEATGEGYPESAVETAREALQTPEGADHLTPRTSGCYVTY